MGPVPDCADNLFMRSGQPCYTFLYAPAVRAASLRLPPSAQQTAVRWLPCRAHCTEPARLRPLPAIPLQGDPEVEAVVQGIREHNSPPIPPEHTLGLANASAIDAWLLAHPEAVHGVGCGAGEQMAGALMQGCLQ